MKRWIKGRIPAFVLLIFWIIGGTLPVMAFGFNGLYCYSTGITFFIMGVVIAIWIDEAINK